MAEEQGSKSNIKTEFNNATTGLNQDNTLNQIKPGSLTYALNAVVENHDSNSINYQNEPGTNHCVDFPEGYILIGHHFIPERTKHVYFLANPTNGGSQIGYMDNNNCIYKTLACSNCLNFSVNHPIHSIVHKVTIFGVEIYWPDNNGRRYLNIDDIPRPLKSGSSLCDPDYEDAGCEIDCAQIKLQPNFSIPVVKVVDAISGGENTSGTVQFTVQYADAKGNPYTSFYDVTNPTPIADTSLVTVNFDSPVGKSIVVDIQNLDVSGQFQYFNLAVIKTVNGISTPELVGTYFIDRDNKQITYTGQNQTQIQLSIEDIFEKFPYYEKADHVTAVQDILVWSGLTAKPRTNYQEIANGITVQWETHRIPAGKTYSNEVLATNKRSYLRDEVYALEFQPILASGQELDGFHIPGKEKNAFELSAPNIYPDNPDFIGTVDPGAEYASYWRVYNTATVEGTSPSYTTDENYEGPYQYGQMAYWESIEEYPCNVDVWGKLAGKKIRHHKFPDVLVSPIFESKVFPGQENLVSEDRAIFPIGIKIDINQIKQLIANSSLTQEEKDDIVGFKILRGDRGVNKSIVAKGMLRNVNKYTREEQDFYYPNYPYNDVTDDPFINIVNNAWAGITKPWVINVVKFNQPLDSEGNTVANPTFMLVEHTDINTNNIITTRYDSLGEQPILCSATKPVILGPGEKNRVRRDGNNWVPASGIIATVRTLNYSVWWCRVDPNRAGYNLQWNDPVEGIKERWMSGGAGPFQSSDSILVWTIVGERPVNISSGRAENNEDIDFQYTTEFEDPCNIETPSVPIIENKEELSYRQIFNSPETSFGQPFLGDILKLESVMYGTGNAHFVQVKDNAKYRLLTLEAQTDALTAAQHIANQTNPLNYGAMFTAYQAYLQIYLNGITRKNYGYSFNSIASYNYSLPIPNNQGVKQRNLDIKKYLIPAVQNVGEQDININNYNRETSVFLRTIGSEDGSIVSLPLPHLSPEMLSTGLVEDSRFTISEKDLCATPAKYTPINVISYYGSLKNNFLNQWGQIYSYQTINTGYTVIFGKEGLSGETVFGGDTFIGKFAYKTKVPFFIDNRVGAPDDSDIFYDEIGNIAYPKYWHSARSILSTYSKGDVTMYNMISIKAHNFDCPNKQGEASEDLISNGADPADNPDRTFYNGYMYLFSYGIPSFYCESSYNLDLRTAFNNKEGDFWPHVSTGIPDDWVQENNVSILNDNTYNYNVTLSKQNKETFIPHLPADWSKDYKNTSYPFRAIYSDIQNTDADNRVNSWLTYRALSYFDFPQNFGPLTALDGLANKAVLARFENKSLLYNALVTIDTSNPQAAYVGNPRLFSNPPIDYADTDLGYIGSQNKMLLKIPQGAVFSDAKRGQIFLVNGTEAVDLTAFGSGMNRFFTDHLSFKILKYFPNVNTDNNYNGVGLHGVYDSKFERIIITKLDYIPLFDTIIFDEEENKFYNVTDIKTEVFLTDQDFFCNKSFTISFNFNTKSWVSFHSYIPNWYIGENNFFYSGVNHCPNDFDALVGILSDTFDTTTTTTTRYIQITTTTTTTAYVPDCELEGEIVIPECDFEGIGTIIETEEPCVRPEGMGRVMLISGYELVTPETIQDTTPTSGLACTNLGYYNSVFIIGGENYVPIMLEAYTLGISIGNYVYIADFTDECNYIPDGWYFTDESANAGIVFNIVGGVIVETHNCNDIYTTTTTTTTHTIPSKEYCFVGAYTEDDPEHPLGGIIVYLDQYGDERTVVEMWAGEEIIINASVILSMVDVLPCPEDDITTTTTSSSTTEEPTTTTTTSSTTTEELTTTTTTTTTIIIP